MVTWVSAHRENAASAQKLILAAGREYSSNLKHVVFHLDSKFHVFFHGFCPNFRIFYHMGASSSQE